MTQEYKSFSPEEFRLHNEKLQAEMEKQDIDMLLLSTPENIYYSTGYRSWYTSSLFRPVYVLVPREGDPAIILRILEKTTVQYTSWTSRIYCWTHRAIPTKEATQEGFFVKNKNREKAKHTAPTPKAGSGATGTWKAPKKQPRAPVQPKASSTP